MWSWRHSCDLTPHLSVVQVQQLATCQFQSTGFSCWKVFKHSRLQTMILKANGRHCVGQWRAVGWTPDLIWVLNYWWAWHGWWLFYSDAFISEIDSRRFEQTRLAVCLLAVTCSVVRTQEIFSAVWIEEAPARGFGDVSFLCDWLS